MLLERLERGAVLCAEGYLFELERRGFLQAGAWPEVVRSARRRPAPDTSVRARGLDVVEALT